MKTNKTLLELKGNVEQFSPYWREWSHNERCLLSGDEKRTIDEYVKRKFELTFSENLFFFRESQKIKFLNYKLRYDHKTYKEWIVEMFLFRLIKLGELNNEKNYTTLIWELNLEQDLKENLAKFNTFTLNEIFQRYKPEDFLTPVIYNKVVDTLKILRRAEDNLDIALKTPSKQKVA